MNARTRSFDTLLFDVDGTLIDSNGAHAAAWVQALHEHGIMAEVAQIRALIGMGGDKLLPAVAKVNEESPLGKAMTHRKKEIFSALLPALQPTPGARPLLEYLREQDIDIVIATSADGRELSALLQQARLADLIPDRISKDDAPASKPDPDIVQAALKQSEVSPDRALLVGDTPYDIQAANRAAVTAIALRCGGYWGDEDLRDALVILDDPAALLVYLREQRRAGAAE